MKFLTRSSELLVAGDPDDRADDLRFLVLDGRWTTGTIGAELLPGEQTHNHALSWHAGEHHVAAAVLPAWVDVQHRTIRNASADHRRALHFDREGILSNELPGCGLWVDVLHGVRHQVYGPGVTGSTPSEYRHLVALTTLGHVADGCQWVQFSATDRLQIASVTNAKRAGYGVDGLHAGPLPGALLKATNVAARQISGPTNGLLTPAQR
jgi:hypothetical protein